jgi:signal transduction histidine kinase
MDRTHGGGRDVWLVWVCGALQLLFVSSGQQPDPPVWGLAVGTGAAVVGACSLVRRRRWPYAVLAVTTVAQVVQVLVAGPVFPAVTTVAVFSVARWRLAGGESPAGTAAALFASVLCVSGSVALAGHGAFAAPYALLVVLGLLAGSARSQHVARVEAQRRDLVRAERLRIARDLHDSVGHGVGAMTVQAGAGRMAVAAGATVEATRALQSIEDAGRMVLRDLRWMVGLLREDENRPQLPDVRALVETARRSGLDVSFREEGDLAAASPDVGEVAYRVVQEAITNVLRHSNARSATVRLAVGREVEVEVCDEGSSAAGTAAVGNGLRGMRERVAAVGGRLDAGPVPSAGWAVRAALPAGGEAR